MKRLLLLWLSALPLWISAANTLTLSTASGRPGDVLTITASLTNSDAVSAVQADIPLGPHLSYVANSAELVSARSNGHSLIAAAVNDTLHVTIFSLSAAALNGAEGDLFTFQLSLGIEPATYTLTPAVTFAAPSGEGLAASVVAGSATILSPKIEVVTTSIDYGHIPIRSTYNRTLQVRNTGNEPLHISDVIFSASEFSVTNTEYTIAAGQTLNITLTYSPVLHGAISETVRLRSDAINDANIYGANLAVLTADPYSVNELRVQPASGISDETVSVTLRMNNMETDLVGVQVSFKMPTALVYVANSVAPLQRANGMLATSVLSHDTLTLMLYSLSNTPIASEDGDLLTFDVQLNGTSGSYALKPINTLLINTVGKNMVSAVYQANVTIQSPRINANASLDFGHVPVTEKCTTSYSVRNSGQAPLTVDGAVFLQEGFRLLTPMPLVIAKNVTSNLEIEFTPSAEGNVATTMQLYSDDPTARMKSVAVSGSVYEPNALTLSGTTVRSTYCISVGLDNYSDISGLQFDLSWPLEQEPAWQVERTARASGHQVSWSKVEDGIYRFILFTLSNTPLDEHSGDILTLTLDATTSALLDGQNIAMSNALIVHPTQGNKEVTLPPSLTIAYAPQVFHLVFFVDWDGTVLSEQEVVEGTAATPPADPEREGYIFTGWGSDFSNITEFTIVLAQYEELVKEIYSVRFYDWDNTLLKTDSVEYGEDATAPANPTRTGYTFTGWDKEYTNVTKSLEVNALYSINYYTVRFFDWNNTLLKTESVAYQSAATPPANPLRVGYTFTGWSDAYSSITADIDITAQYTPIQYPVCFVDWDGAVLSRQDVDYGTAATPPASPSREGYTFTSWSGNYAAIYSETVSVALYEPSSTRYSVTYEDGLSGEELSVESIWLHQPATPTHDGYLFSGYYLAAGNLNDGFAIEARYSAKNNAPAKAKAETMCMVYFLDWDNTLLAQQSVPFGGAATPPANPTRAGYIFTGWSTDIMHITNPATFAIAQYQLAQTGVYAVRFLDWDGTLLKEDSVAHGQAATAPANPTRSGYTFTGWDKDFSVVKENMAVNAVYRINCYAYFVDWDGTVLSRQEVDYGAAATPPASPSRAGYTFAGWSGTYSHITELTILVALYDEIPSMEGAIFTFSDGLTTGVLAEERIVLHVPTPSLHTGYDFTGWNIVEGALYDGIVIKSSYQSHPSDPTAIDQVDSSSLLGGDRGRLILRDNQIYILRGDKTYTITGQAVK